MRLPAGTGRTLFIAALTGAIFAGFLLVSPKLSAVGTDAGTTSTTPPAPTTSTGPTSTTAPAAATSTTTLASKATIPYEEPMTPRYGYDGSVALSVVYTGTNDDPALLVDGDRVRWHFDVTNQTEERLWGVFVWLELVGRAECDGHRVDPGRTLHCSISATAVAGDHVAEAWVNAWTSTRQVKDRVFVPFHVGG